MRVASRGGQRRNLFPLASLVVAYLMMATLLPNPLRVPSNEATTTAEFAPVVGKKDASASGGSISETGFAESAGIGSDGLGTGEFAVDEFGNPLPQLPTPIRKPRDKTCYAGRQAEDPLSPPCVAAFEGDNGGATYPGVTGDKITAVMYDGLSDIPDGENMCDPPSDEDGLSTRTLKALSNYFQRRYQTYNRRVCVIKQADSGAEDTNRKGDAIKTVQEYEPFAVMSFAEPNDDEYLKQISKQGVTSFGLNFFQPQSYYDNNAPLAFSFFDTQEEHVDITAEYMCRKLAKNPVRHTDDATLRGRPRKFGLIYTTGTQAGEGEPMGKLLQTLIKQKCGLEFGSVAHFEDPGLESGSGGADNAAAVAQMRGDGVTTIHMIGYGNAIQLAQQTASASGYFPEWFLNSASVFDVGPVARLFADPRQRNFGVSLRWRTPAITETFWYQAYQQEAPGTLAETRWGYSWYYLLLNLYTAVQAAGPRLTPDAIARGMFTFKTDDLNNPYLPSGEYGEPNDYAFVSSYMEWYWDPRGTPPDGNPNEGCVRVTNEGKRFRAPQLTSDESGLYNPASPCTADIRFLQPGVGG